MRPARFVTFCFLYSGGLVLVSGLLKSGIQLGFQSIVRLLLGLTILFVGVYRLWQPEEERHPEEYGLFSYGMAVLTLLMTVIFLGQLLL